MKTPIIIGIIQVMIRCCCCARSSVAMLPVIFVVMNIDAPTNTGNAKFSGI